MALAKGGVALAHLHQVHQVVVAVLQEVYAELPQEEPDVERRAAPALAVPRPAVPLGDAPHRLPRIVAVVLELTDRRQPSVSDGKYQNLT